MPLASAASRQSASRDSLVSVAARPGERTPKSRSTSKAFADRKRSSLSKLISDASNDQQDAGRYIEETDSRRRTVLGASTADASEYAGVRPIMKSRSDHSINQLPRLRNASNPELSASASKRSSAYRLESTLPALTSISVDSIGESRVPRHSSGDWTRKEGEAIEIQSKRSSMVHVFSNPFSEPPKSGETTGQLADEPVVNDESAAAAPIESRQNEKPADEKPTDEKPSLMKNPLTKNPLTKNPPRLQIQQKNLMFSKSIRLPNRATLKKDCRSIALGSSTLLIHAARHDSFSVFQNLGISAGWRLASSLVSSQLVSFSSSCGRASPCHRTSGRLWRQMEHSTKASLAVTRPVYAENGMSSLHCNRRHIFRGHSTGCTSR